MTINILLEDFLSLIEEGKNKMKQKEQKKENNQNNSVPKFIFLPNKTSRTLTILLVILVDLVAIYYGISNWNSFSQVVLIETASIGFTVVLAVVALGIAVLQTDKELLKDVNTNENKNKVYLSYIFGMFPIILVLVLGYLVAYVLNDYSQIMSLYFIAAVLASTRSITGTVASFVAFLNIRD